MVTLCLQEEYIREAIPWNFTEFVDNRPCLDLLECNPGLFALLNEVGATSHTHAFFLSGHKRLVTLTHYVTYVTGFINICAVQMEYIT